MINLQNVLDMWEEDCKIDSRDLSKDGITCALMHSKYLNIYTQAKLELTNHEMKQKILLKKKWLYYNGKMDEKEIDSLGWEYDPFQGLKILKTDMDKYYDSDPDIQKSEELIQYYKTIIETLREIMDNIKWRSQTIKNMIEWRKFERGE